MGAEDIIVGGGEEETTAAAVTMASESGSSAPASPRNKVKLLCSHGGKILPRTTDGHLKYVGGETRIVSFPRDINFSGTLPLSPNLYGYAFQLHVHRAIRITYWSVFNSRTLLDSYG